MTEYRDILAGIIAETGEWPRVCDDTPGGRPGTWRVWHHDDTAYSYRTVLSTECVFDIGDHGDWGRCRRDSIALWGRLEREGYVSGVDYWPALSGGRGTHTHVFLDGDRRRFANWAIRSKPWQPRIEADPCVISPEKGGHMIREFGVTHPATGRAKTMWTLPYDALPGTKDKAYNMAMCAISPSSYRNVGLPRGAVNRAYQEAFGGRCPKNDECYDMPPCLRCPASR